LISFDKAVADYPKDITEGPLNTIKFVRNAIKEYGTIKIAYSHTTFAGIIEDKKITIRDL